MININYFQSWSGGKDSTASIILEHIHGLPISTIIFSEVMFDRSRGISGESPDHMEWVHNVAVPMFKSWGHNVIILHSEKDYLDLFFHKPILSKNLERREMLHGFLIAGRCAANRDLKIKPIKQFFKNIEGDFTQYLGIAIDEPERLSRLENTNKISLLAKYSLSEKQAFDLCRQYGLLSPIYEHSCRGGCWFCPNATIREYAYIKQFYPDLWSELQRLSYEKNVISTSFKYNLDFTDVDRKVDEYIALQKFYEMQLTLYDLK